MFLPKHLICYNGYYYYLAKVPVDLRQHFSCTFIKKSLRTKKLADAKTLLVAMQYRVYKAFTALRTGMLSDDLSRQVVQDIIPIRNKIDTVGSKLSTVIGQYEAEKESGWTYKTKLEVTGCHRLVLDILEDADIKSINRQVVLAFRDKLMRLPANMYKCYPGKNVNDVLALADIKPMSINSVNKHILRLNALMSYAAKEGIIATNPAQGLMLTDKRRDDELRKTYSAEDLEKILINLPVDPERPERFWIPIVAMYSGLRLDEICQLYVDDIQLVDGIWCFNVNDECDKKVKAESSKRIVPIHPELISKGFLCYVDRLISQKAPRLWMALSWRKEDGYSNGFGNWYRRFNRQYVTDDPKKVFHSLRHMVADTLKQAGVQEVIIEEILGHTHKSISTGRYGKRYQPKVLLEALKLINYHNDLTKDTGPEHITCTIEYTQEQNPISDH